MIKSKIIRICQTTLNDKVSALQHELFLINDSMTNDTKSSAGDKYETGREVMSKEIDKLNSILKETLLQKETLEKLNIKPNIVIGQGSLIKTDKGYFFLAISVGKIEVENVNVFCLSSASPLGALFVGKQTKDKVSFNNFEYSILEVS